MNDLKLTLKGKIITVEVPSSRGGYHKVAYNLENETWCCTCEDFFYRRRVCKHIQQAKDFVEETLHMKTSNFINNGEHLEENDTITGLIQLRNELTSLKEENPELDLRASYRTINRLLASQRT